MFWCRLRLTLRSDNNDKFALPDGGAVVTETVFGLPGVGSLVVSAVLRRDYPVIQGALLIIAAIYVLINLFIDLLYLLVDPRVRY